MKFPFAPILAALALTVAGVAQNVAAQNPAQGGQAPPAGTPAGRGGRGGPPVDPVAAARGGEIYGPRCAACHGADARGGETGSDLGRSTMIAEDVGGDVLMPFLRVGRPERGMPAFPTLSAAEANDLVSFIRSKSAQTRTGSPATVLVGNAKGGEAFFNGADLKGVGSKYDPMTLQGRIVWPRGTARGRGAAGDVSPVTVTVTRPTGEKLSGVLVSSDDFFVVLRDAAGNRKSVARTETTKVEIKDPLQAHFDNLRRLTDTQMHDLTAYLVTIK